MTTSFGQSVMPHKYSSVKMYLANVSTRVEGVAEDHLATGNLGSAGVVVQVQTGGIIANGVEVGSLNHNLHAIGGAVYSA